MSTITPHLWFDTEAKEAARRGEGPDAKPRQVSSSQGSRSFGFGKRRAL